MGEIVEFPKRKDTAFTVRAPGYVSVLPIEDIRDLASGKVSIAEFGNPEALGQTLALIIVDYLDGSE